MRDVTLATCLHPGERDVAQHRTAAGADLQQAVQVATVTEHAPAAFRDLLKVVTLANRGTHQTLRAHVRSPNLAVLRCERGHWHRETMTTLDGT